MVGDESKLLAHKKAWKAAVSLSAGMLIRDHGKGAYFAARKTAQQALADENDKACRFWKAVAREISLRTGEVAGEHERSDLE